MTVYLSAEDVVQMNIDFGGPGAGVVDRGGVEGAVARCRQSVLGEDAFPTIWLKAGALLHGLCATQYFSDGNKRTAWAAAETFLNLNGIELGDIDDVQADVFVRAIGVDSTLGVETAAEWFEVTHKKRRVGYASDPRLEYLTIVRRAYFEDQHGGFVFEGVHGHTFTSPDFPIPAELSLVTRIHWWQEDVGKPQVLHAYVDQADRVIAPLKSGPPWRNETNGPVAGAHSHHRFGIMPSIVNIPLHMSMIRPGDATIVAMLNDVEVGRVPIKLVQHDAAPDDVSFFAR